jgi:hypothetical protein
MMHPVFLHGLLFPEIISITEVNKMMKRFLMSMLAMALCIAPFSAMAGDAGKAKQVTCAAIKIFECTMANGCQEVTAESVDLPQMFRIDFSAKTITGIIGGKERTTKIEQLEYIDGKLMLYGAEDGRGDRRDGAAWSCVIDEMTGNLVFSASGDNVVFNIFGACIPR